MLLFVRHTQRSRNLKGGTRSAVNNFENVSKDKFRRIQVHSERARLVAGQVKR